MLEDVQGHQFARAKSHKLRTRSPYYQDSLIMVPVSVLHHHSYLHGDEADLDVVDLAQRTEHAVRAA